MPAATRMFSVPDVEVEDLIFRAALVGTAAIASIFVAWVQLSPPRLEDLDVAVEQGSILVADLPRIVLPEPMPLVMPVHELTNPRESLPTRRAPAPPRAQAAGPRGSLLVQQAGTLAPGTAAATLFDMDTARLDEALRGVSRSGDVAQRDGGGFRRRTDEGDAIIELGFADEGETRLGVAKVAVDIQVPDKDVEVDGNDGDASTIRAVLRKYQGRMQTCYERVAKQDDSLGGRVELGWVIQAGRVSDVRIVANTTGNADLATCMQGAMRAVRFPLETSAEVSRFPWVFTGR